MRKCGQGFACVRIPDHGFAVVSASQEMFSVRAEGYGPDQVFVFQDRRHRLTGLCVPDADVPEVVGGRYSLAVL